MRRVIAFPCVGETLLGTIDTPIAAASSTGLLIVSGGNEIRAGAHRGMAALAAALAAAGHPVMRYDRRGIGDSSGENAGFAGSAPDLAAAVAAFRRETPDVARIVGFGNCDAATALALFHRQAGLDALVLANPWIGDDGDALPARAAIRARYAQRLRDPETWRRALRGELNFDKSIKGIGKLIQTKSRTSPHLAALADALGNAEVPVTILLASGDNTAIAFADAWRGSRFARARARTPVRRCDTASHSFARANDKAWLAAQLIDLLRA
ncbi:hydrolase 1, exosortase A system-associated [Sphingomonas sp. SFZ2018-12]|uniref:hydrolase 1, exosortase A system-associated n=1 Tax=Sphingomonas sp. SFZ2018-12 TaxID=2683197 RepID=UPI001F0DDF7E|nr:hydrolase 1, exosortase A system-associated [Sphingomonas sp. SFZ2018-12]MCH4892256.1 hydrolase 1, exosortase A system-associated [Sphingomonas sp. SFZ2018-12]